jgi:hypothetical protein
VFTHWRAAGFHLPHEKTIKEYTRWNSEAPGFNDDVLRQLAISYEDRHSYHARAGYLAFDAMSVQEEVVLNRRTCDIEGFQNVGNLVSYTNNLFAPPKDDAIKAIQLAKQCLQLVFISMDGLHKVPIGYFLVESENATLIVEMVHAAIMRLMIINIHTVAFIGDGSGPNRSAFEQLTSVAPQTVLAGSNWNDDSTQFTVAMPHPHPSHRELRARLPFQHLGELQRLLLGQAGGVLKAPLSELHGGLQKRPSESTQGAPVRMSPL